MSGFTIEGCQVLWDKKAKVSKEDKLAIVADLRCMSRLIEDAVNYTKERMERKTGVEYSLGPIKDTHSYYLQIFYDPEMQGWDVTINTVLNKEGYPEKFVGEIVSETWQLTQTFHDEDYGVPETI